MDGRAFKKLLTGLIGLVIGARYSSTDPAPSDGDFVAVRADDQGNLLVFPPLRIVSVGVEVARPADTTAYAALDAVSDSTSAPTVLQFAGMARKAGLGGAIVKAKLWTDQKTCTARFRLHLFNASPAAINDNSPFTLLYTTKATRVGYIDFGGAATEDPTNSTAAAALSASLRLAYACAAADTKLYGILETLDAFTPASGQKVYVELLAELN